MYNSAYFQERYEYVRKLGEGGSASVALIKDRNINKLWAAKFVRKTGCIFDADSEIEMLKSLDYYLFPRIVDAFCEDESICIVTDYVKGENLKSYISREGPLSVNVALMFTKELLKALIYLHSRNPSILYLDMKPENIMLTDEGEIRLVDFGIARSVLLKNKCIGTNGYSPPEQYICGKTVDERADVFSLAMTVYSLLTGKIPKADLKKQREDIHRSTKIPPDIKRILLKCTNERIEKRPYPKDVLRMIEKMNSGRNTTALLWMSMSIFIIAGSILLSTGANYMKRIKSEEYLREMIKLSNEHVVNGEYDKEGIGIICGYINGGYLNDESKDLYTYKVALNLFNVQKDYSSAYPYLKRVQESGYADVTQYLSFCEKMRNFSDSNDLLEVFGYEIKGDNRNENYKKD